jgi:phosphatidylglycerol:prolipoprotein diacylglycerol transferase
MIKYPNINPDIISIGSIHLRWYGIAYALGFFIAYLYMKSRFKKFNNNFIIDDALMYAVFGVIIGGRLGYIFIYNLSYYMQHPVYMLYVWRGGMSFHGGLVGVIIAGILLAKKYNLNFYDIADEVVVIVPIGLFFGRIANFINDELWGRVSNVPWAIAFPNGGYLPRHPSQLYEAIFEGILLFAILYLVRDNFIKYKGVMFYLFVLLYGIFRFFIEFTRQPDAQLGFIYHLTMGQWLCLSMIAVSSAYLIYRYREIR